MNYLFLVLLVENPKQLINSVIKYNISENKLTLNHFQGLDFSENTVATNSQKIYLNNILPGKKKRQT